MPEQERNIEALVVPRVGRVEEVTDGLVPYRLVDASGSGDGTRVRVSEGPDGVGQLTGDSALLCL